MDRITRRVALVLATLSVVTSLGMVVHAKVSSTAPRWVTATRDWVASGVTPGSSGPLPALRRALARSLSPASQGKGATVTTDEVNYLPQSKVVVSGSGFMPGEIVEVTFAEQLIPGGYVDAPVIVDETADHKGNFINRDYKTDDHHANITVVITAQGLVSGATASATIGDGAVITTDLQKYGVGQVMVISGAGFTPDSTVTVTIVRPDHLVDTITPKPSTDHNGTFSANYLPPQESGRFKITATDGVNSALTAVTEADPLALNNDQCLNGTGASPNNCAVLGGGNGWSSGNANNNKAHYTEGGSIVYRSVITGTGATNTTHKTFAVSISWDVRTSSKNALDYITYPVRAGFGETVNPCDGVGVTNSSGVAVPSCVLPKLGSGDPLPSGVTAFDFDSSIGPSGTSPLNSISAPAGTQGASTYPMPGTSWNALRATELGAGGTYSSSSIVIAGGTITSMRYGAQGDLTVASSTTRVVIYVDVYSDNFVLSFGGHIGSRLEWGFDATNAPNSAGGISGSSYHLHQDGLCTPISSPTDCTSGAGSADLQLAAAAVAVPTHLTLVKVVSGGTAQPTDWTLSATGLSSISGVSGSAAVTDAVVSPGSYTLAEGAGPAGYTAGTYSCVTNGGAPVVSNSVTLASGDIATCTITNTAQGTIVLVKNTTGGDGSFAFTTTGGGGLSNTTLTTVGGTKAQTFTNVSTTATFSITEVMPAGWQAGAATTCTTGTNASFTVTAGGTTTCTFSNTKQSTIILVKNTTGGDGSFAFTTTGGGGFSNTTLTTSGGTKAQTFTNVDPTKTFSVTEAMPAGWQRGAPTTCTTGTNDSFTVTAGSTTTCTFSNQKQSTIVLVKNTHGGNGSFAFTTTGGGGFSNTTLTTSGGTAAQTYTNVDPTQTFSVTEAMPAGWQIGSATTCTSGTAASFTVAAGATVTCTFDNVRQSTIILVKNTTGGDGSFAFTTTGGGGLVNTTLTTSASTAAQTFTNIDPTKTFSINETLPGGWQLSGSNCTAGTPASFTVAAGGSVTCTFSNAKQSTVILVKNTHGGNGSFAFTTTNLGGGTTTLTTVASTASQTYTNVDPNLTYNVSETMPTSWQQGVAPNCVGQATGNVSNFTVAAGTTVTCTFDNVKQSTIVLVKNTHGGDGAFAFTATGGGGFSSTTLTTASGTAAQTYANVDPTKTFSVTEAMPAGWQIGLATTCTTGTNASFTIAAGGTTTCTFDNTKQSTIVLVKNTHGGDGSFAFTTTGGGGLTNTTLTTASGTKAQTFSNVDPTHTFSIAESMPTGWQIGLATTCTGGTAASFTVAAGGTATCTFDNTKLSTIVLVKNTIGGNGSFAFTTTGGGGFSNTTLTTVGGTAAQTYTNVDPTKTFSVTEAMPSGWGPGGATTCTMGTNTSFTVAAGGTTTCTFTNAKNPQLTLTKHVNNVFGGALSTDFTMTGSGPTPISFAGTVTSGPGFQAGTYQLGETNLAGYLSGIWNCVGGGVFSYGNPAAYNTAILSLSPTAFWRFNELGGPTLADATGNGHTLTMPDIEYGVPGAIGGTTTGVDVSNGKFQMADISVPVGAASFEWWIKPLVQGGDTYGTLIEDNNNFGNGFYLRDDGAGKVNATAFFFADQLNTTAMKTDGTLYHLVATVDGSGHGQWYLNGVADGTFTYGALNLDRAFSNDAQETLQATLVDEMAVYPSQLSGATVAAHYSQGIANASATYQTNRLAESPTAYWQFEEAGGSTLADAAAGHLHTLTMPSITFGVIGDTIGSTGLAMTNGVAGMTPIALPAGSARSFSWVLKPLVQGGDGYGTLLEDSQNFGNGFYLQDNGAGKVWLDAFFGSDQHNNTPLNTDGTLYHVVASIDASGNGTWYVNGVADGTFTYFPSSGFVPDRAFQNEAYEALKVSLIDRMAIFPFAITGAQATAQFNLATAKTTVSLGFGDIASCDITNSDEFAHLKLVKNVTKDNGGTAVATDFYLAAKGPTPMFGKGVVEKDVYVGTYSLLESNLPGYTPGPWVCVGGSQNGSQVTLTQGQSAVCTITNDDIAPSLTLVKQLNITHGGTAVATNWTLTATGPTTISGAGGTTSDATFDAGTYALSESAGPSGYTAGAWNCVGGSMGDATHVTVGLGQGATCTIINSDQPARLIVRKIVINDNGGASQASAFSFTVNGGSATAFVGSGLDVTNTMTVNAGTYSVTEPAATGYTTTYGNSLNGNANCTNLVIPNGGTATCTITNNDVPPSQPAPCFMAYPFVDAQHPLANTAFSESTVLKAFQHKGAGTNNDTIRMWYSDEHALSLGVSQVQVKTGGGTTSTNYTVTAMVGNPSSAAAPNLFVGATALTGDQAGTDPSLRPIYPALFITDLGVSPSVAVQTQGYGTGDWQFGGAATVPSAVYGTWKSATRLLDKTVNPNVVTLTPAADPSKNTGWNLGPGADTVPAAALANDEGYSAEVTWKISDLRYNGQPLDPTHTYRVQFMVHDGDQNKTGGDAGEGCLNIVPGFDNADPIVTADDAYKAGKNTSLTVAAAAGLLTNDTDPNTGAAPMTVRSVTGIAAGTVGSPVATTHGTVTVQVDGSVSYTPAANFTGTDTFTYTATDAMGADSNTGTVTITVVNPSAINAANNSYAVVQNITLNVAAAGVLANDHDPNTGASPLTVAKVNGSAANVGVPTATTHGTVTLNADGSFAYTPALNYTGTDTFTYTATDALGATSNTATVTLTVSAPPATG